MTYDIAFTALASETRRAILLNLKDAPKPVGALAAALPVSRPAVSQHLKVLSDAGLVSVTPEGTRNIYALDPKGLSALRGYLDQLWDDALDAFAQAARSEAAKDAL